MKINRQKFLLHLERLLCGGQIPEAVFSGAFSASALTPDQMLLVAAPALPAIEPLQEEIGIADVKRLIDTSKLNQGEGNLGVEVNVYVDDSRLVIDDSDRGKVQLIIAAPKTIATRIEKETVEELLDAKPTGKVVPLTRSIVEGVRRAFSLLKAEEIEVHVGPSGGEIVVGSSRTDQVRYPLDVKTKEEYVLIFGKHLVDVFGIISDYSSASFRLGGAGQPILLEDGGYRYLLSPRIRSADESIKGDDTPAPAEASTDVSEEVEEAPKPSPRKKKK